MLSPVLLLPTSSLIGREACKPPLNMHPFVINCGLITKSAHAPSRVPLLYHAARKTSEIYGLLFVIFLGLAIPVELLQLVGIVLFVKLIVL